MRARHRTIVQDAGVIGWISISEVFLLCGVTMLAIALAVESHLDETQSKLDVAEKAESELPQLKKRNEKLEREKLVDLGKIDDLERARTSDRREIVDLKSLLVSSNRKHTQLSDEIARLGRQLETADAERAALRTRVSYLKKELERLDAELKTSVAQLADSKATILTLRKRLAEIDESIVLPLASAKLVIKLTCARLPDGYDIDLFVEDPYSKVCYWAEPRVLNELQETGFLMPSEDLKRLRNTTEEIFYSPSLFPTPDDKPYVVFCMVRPIPGANLPALDVVIHWEVSATLKDGTKTTKHGDKRFTTPGRVAYANGNYGYPGLEALTAFWTSSDQKQQPRFVTEGLPGAPRNWSGRELPPDAGTVLKAREQ
jgi:hypothetical protein